jgi:hypothetical protein
LAKMVGCTQEIRFLAFLANIGAGCDGNAANKSLT